MFLWHRPNNNISEASARKAASAAFLFWLLSESFATSLPTRIFTKAETLITVAHAAWLVVRAGLYGNFVFFRRRKIFATMGAI
jgi:hypothetical protein